MKNFAYFFNTVRVLQSKCDCSKQINSAYFYFGWKSRNKLLHRTIPPEPFDAQKRKYNRVPKRNQQRH